MADTDFGQLWVELNAQNKVSPQLRQIINDFQLVDNSVARTKKRLEEFSDVEVSKNTNQIEKNWRSVRGAIVDFKTEIDKLKGKLKELDDLGIGRETNAYRKYEEQLKKLISLRRQLMDRDRDKRGDLLGSDDITRFKSELSIARKEVANTDIQAKKLVETQRQNVSAVERMVTQYDRMSTSLKSARQSALDSGMTTMGTQYLQNTINRIQSISDALRQALNNPASITTNMVQQAQQQFERLEQMAKNHASRIKEQMSARLLMVDSQAALTKMETGLDRIRNKLQSLKDDKKITVNTSDLDLAKQKLEDFINRYKRIITSGNLTKGDAKRLAEEYTQLTNEAEKARAKIEGLAAAERSRASASMQRPVSGTVEALRQTQAAMDPIIQKMQQLQSATTRTGVVWDQFKTQIAFTAFSVYGLEHFLKSIITVGGEFERQRVALQNMLGDMREASEIFGQLKNLALESPFTFRQLSTYTKQLAAFSIPYEELYDTNRRLSDMSAGLGVDMSRLILAYGQVRAATVLRGQELRQFTEAGVPMVEKLADYFTKLNGELVTTRDIFQMISKKQVPFEAVRAVMQEMTDEGGMFYNMQAKIADTLSGRWGNLKDAWEILLGELADSESIMGNILKQAVEGITAIIRNLRSLTGVLGGLAAGKMFSSLGLGVFGAVGGSMTGSLDKFYLKAKQMRAMELQRIALTKELDPIERDILATKNKITSADRMSMLMNGQLNKYQAAMLVRNGQLNRMATMRLALENGITSAEIRQLANSSKLSLLWGNIREKMSDFFGSINWASLGITAGIMAIGALAGAWMDYTHKMEEARKNIAEQATQTRNDLTDFFSKDQFDESLDAGEAKRYIEKYEEELKKIAPNFLEIKSRIVGEHGESPQEQAKAYRDELQKFLNNSEVSEHVAQSTLENDDRGFGRDTFIEKANAYYREMRNLRDEMLRLDPIKLIAMAESMDGLNDSTKAQVRLLIEQGRKLEAIKRIKDSLDKPGVSRSVTYPDDNFYVDYTSVYNRLFFDSPAKREYKDAADEFFSSMKEDIKNSFSQYFDKEGKWIGGDDLRASILKGMRDGLSERGADTNSMSGIMMEFEREVFGTSQSTAVDMLANAFVQKNQGLIAKFKESGGVVTDEIRRSLDEQAHNIALTDFNFMQNLDYLLNGQGNNEIIKRIRIIVGLDDPDLKEWQQVLVDKFGEDYKLAIKAAPDIASALEACQNLYDKAKSKIETMKPLMLQMGINFSGGSLPEDHVPSFISPQYQGLYKDFAAEFNQNMRIQQSGIKNGLVDKGAKKSGNKKTGSGRKEDKELQAWQRHVELYKKFLDQYRELTKMYGEKEALDKLQTSKAYEWIISFAKARGLDATDIDSMNEALNGILNVNKGDKQKRKDAKAKREAEIQAEGYKRAGEELKRLNDQLNENLKRLNEQYDAYQKIFQITGNKEGAMQLAFGGNVTNERYIDELTEQLRDALKAANWSGTIDEALEMTKEKVNKVFGEESEAANLINKTKEERNKLEKEYIDILANALTSDMSLEDKRAEAVRKYNEELRILIERRNKANKEEAKAEAQAGIDALNNAHNRTMAGYDTKIYERDMNLGGLMNNLSAMSTYMLTGIRDSLEMQRRRYEGDRTDEGIAEYDRITEQINKITDVLTERGGLFNMFKEAFSDANEDITYGENGLPVVRGATAARYGLREGQEIGFDTEERIRNMEKMRKLSVAIDKTAKSFKDIEAVLKPVIDLFDALGMEDSIVGQGLQVGSNALSAAGSTAGAFSNLAQAAGPDSPIGSLLSKAGPYGAAAAAALSVATTIFQLHDKALQKEIEASEQRQKEMESLSSNLEKILERSLGGIYTANMDDRTRNRFERSVYSRQSGFSDENFERFGGIKGVAKALKESAAYTKETLAAMKEALDSGTFYDANYAALLAQRDELQRQLDLERDKKKKDNSAISDLEQKLVETEDTLRYYAIDMAKQIYDIDIKSWADELAETIVDAWAKGEDAVEAYKKKVREMMRSLAVNIVAQKVMEPLLKPVEDYITNEMNAKNGRLDENSIIGIGNLLMQQTDEGVRVITGILDRLKAAGWDLSDAEDNASTLGKGIASVTEDTADLLASYINAIRADVAAIRALEERIIESGFAEINSNLALQLTELRNISAFAERNAIAAERILDLFDSVTTVGSNGRKVRV